MLANNEKYLTSKLSPSKMNFESIYNELQEPNTLAWCFSYDVSAKKIYVIMKELKRNKRYKYFVLHGILLLGVGQVKCKCTVQLILACQIPTMFLRQSARFRIRANNIYYYCTLHEIDIVSFSLLL